jgi:hypothetical protein
MFSRFDDFVVSSRAPSRLIEVDSALGGLMGRNESLDGGGVAHLLHEGDFSGWERKSHCRRSGFSPRGVASSQFWQRSRTRM